MTVALENIIPVIGAYVSGTVDPARIDAISIDSRSLQNGVNTLFFAIVGPNNDAHHYIDEVIKQGVRYFVVSQIPNGLEDKATFLVVGDTLSALQKFAAWYRSQFQFPIIGITGSNGKTIVKEWLNFLLSPDYNIIRSPKSYNSQVGVPLSVISTNEHHNLGIFEAGISVAGEMEKIAPIINPTIGILTNIGSAHDEGFADSNEKISEKLKLFSNSELLIFQKNQSVEALIQNKTQPFTWSFHDETADVFILKSTIVDKTQLTVSHQSQQFEIRIPFLDDASVENAIQCLMVLLHLGYEYTEIENRMALLYPVQMRLKVKNGINNTTIIDDSYSSDFQSLKIALDFVESQKQHKRKTIILSDIFQSGLPTEELYTRVSQLIIANKIDRVIGIGETISKYKNKFGNCVTFPTTDAFIEDFENLSFGNETILIKGARQFRFEEIVSLLEEKTHETVLDINLNAISHNLSFFRAKLKTNTKLMVMVKAFGYGYGGFEIAKLLEHHKVDYLGVAFADEGISLKAAGISVPIMVMNPENTSFASILQHGLEPEIYSIKGLKAFIKTAAQKKLTHYPIHLKVDTGMHRLGFEAQHLPELISVLSENNSVQIRSILSHLATSDEVNREFANSQIALFEKLSSELMSALNISPIRHILNTSGITNFENAQYDMVRLGIGLYGVSNDATEQKELQMVGTLRSIISQKRTIPSGDSVGYGRRFVAEATTDIATIPIGYADGISRSWGNKVGFVTINNRPAPIVGSVCMDMLMADVTGINCKEGDNVIVFGESPSVVYMAEKLGTIPYEILTGISQRVKRVFFRE